jgi:hypothetical protein
MKAAWILRVSRWLRPAALIPLGTLVGGAGLAQTSGKLSLYAAAGADLRDYDLDVRNAPLTQRDSVTPQTACISIFTHLALGSSFLWSGKTSFKFPRS